MTSFIDTIDATSSANSTNFRTLGSNEFGFVGRNATLSTTGTNSTAVFINGIGRLIVEGAVLSGSGAAVATVGPASLQIAKSGTLSGIAGITSAGETQIVNDGTIFGYNSAINIGSYGNSRIFNSGIIDGRIIMAGNTNEFVNTGTINLSRYPTPSTTGTISVTIDFTATYNSQYPNLYNNKMSNWGYIGISSGGTAIDGSGVPEYISNYGTIDGNVSLYEGDDSLYNSGRMSSVSMGIGNDTITNLGTLSRADLGAGADLFDGRLGSQVYVFGADGNDTIVGSAFNDTLFGGDDSATGTDSDTLQGLDGDDKLYGGLGADGLMGGAGADFLDGGDGFDTAYYSDAQQGVIIDLVSGLKTGDAAGDTFVRIEAFAGSNYDDSLRGDDTANTLYGQGGNDFLDGRGGSDGLVGGDGDDFLIGGDGIDALYGGAGADTFYYRSLSESDYRETIGDFQSGSDKLQFVRDGFSAQLNFGSLDPNRFVVGDAATQGYGQFIYNSAGNLFWDADGTGSGGAVSVLTLSGRPTLTAADIVIV